MAGVATASLYRPSVAPNIAARGRVRSVRRERLAVSARARIGARVRASCISRRGRGQDVCRQIVAECLKWHPTVADGVR